MSLQQCWQQQKQAHATKYYKKVVFSQVKGIALNYDLLPEEFLAFFNRQQQQMIHVQLLVCSNWLSRVRREAYNFFPMHYALHPFSRRILAIFYH